MRISTDIPNITPNIKPRPAGIDYKPELPKRRISEERIRHMHGVAELMYKYADAFDVKNLDEDGCYLLGLLHDIGYLYDKMDHEIIGGDILLNYFDFPWPEIVCQCVYWHGSTPREYMLGRRCLDDEIPRELILLWWADMNVELTGEHAGEVVGFKKRLENLKNRCGEDSEPYKKCKETIEWLINNMPKELLTR